MFYKKERKRKQEKMQVLTVIVQAIYRQTVQVADLNLGLKMRVFCG